MNNLSTVDFIANPTVPTWNQSLSNHELALPGNRSDSNLEISESEGSEAILLGAQLGIEPRGKLGPHLKLLFSMVEEQPRAKIKDFYETLKSRAYVGSYDLVKKKIHSFRRELGKQAGQLFASVDVPRAQVELVKVNLKGADQELKGYLFTMTLGHSGKYYAEVGETCDMAAFLKCHQNAFEYFGGVPSGVFYDPQESPLMRRLVGGYPFHFPVVDFALHYTFSAQPTPSFAPWMKGRLKRPGKILKKLFFTGYSFSSIETANAEMQAWIQNQAGSSSGQERREMVSKEKLGSLPAFGFNFRDRKQALKLRG